MKKISTNNNYNRVASFLGLLLFEVAMAVALLLLEIQWGTRIAALVIHNILIYQLAKITVTDWDVLVHKEFVILKNIVQKEIEIKAEFITVKSCGILSEIYNVYQIKVGNKTYLFKYKSQHRGFFSDTAWAVSDKTVKEIAQKIKF